ncbi:exodeoxyribonuclease III [Promicromonospora sp. NFX87]|uniref:exodeoxyribonuclease III n=1 Tax=Promicromonospora sp. NFX87 TaxID=3402691 RepID=UPI003AFABAA5
MRLVTWNVNSIRTRVDRVLAFLDRSQADVLAIQETKCRDDQFPTAAFEAAGYEVAHFGLSQWNGVAIVSRVGLTDVATQFPEQPGFAKAIIEDGPDPLLDVVPPLEARAIGATCGGVRVWSLYVPHGRALGDPHYTYKLAWLEALHTSAQAWADAGDAVALMGDWNVIPLDTDVYDVADFAGKTHVSPPERAAFEAFGKAGYTELTRQFIPEEHAYTYWDYQQLAFPRNKGLRIDFCWASPALAGRASGAVIDRDERKGKGASDHVPVIVDLAD